MKSEIQQGLQAERITRSIQFSWNPVRYATPERLGTELDAFYIGTLTIGKFWSMMLARDPELMTAFSKREESVEQLEWQIVKIESLPEGMEDAADAQVKILNDFYSSIRVTDVLKQDLIGGVGVLARQILQARAYGWSVHELIWRPGEGVDGSLALTLRHVPIYWFENRTGKLRFLLNDTDVNGVDMEQGEWMVSASSTFMESVTSLWLYKRNLLQSWVRFCSKYGMPLPIVKIDAPIGSAQWEAGKVLVAAIQEDWSGIMTPDASLEFAQIDRTGDSTFAKLFDEIKRTIITVVIGSDLSTISAQGGAGQGASLQGNEALKKEKSDACMISETCNNTLDKFVLEYSLGPGVPILARFMLVPSKQQNTPNEIMIDRMFREFGIELSVDDLRNRYGRGEPVEGSDTVGEIEAEQQDPAMELANSLVSEGTDQAALGRAKDMLGVCRELNRILKIEDPTVLLNALRHFQNNTRFRAARLLDTGKELQKAIEKTLASATLNGITTAPTK